MNWKKLNKISGITILIFFALAIVISIYQNKQFMKDYKFATGKIIYVNAPGWKSSGDYGVVYEYTIGNKSYQNNNNYNFCKYQTMSKMKLFLLGKQFPIAYSVKDVSISVMLIT